MIGRRISHYRVVSYLGGGAMGMVYKAEDTLLKRPVALKFLPAGLTDDPDACARFIREARAASSLDHPHIGTLHEIDTTEDGTWFIAMAWYDGGTLKKTLETGPLDPVRARSVAAQVADGLAHAHRRGVVHRDIKPANIMITNRDEVKIVDFGLARLLDDVHLTAAGTVMGTAGYMAPEQARGEDAGPPADIWSTGVVLYEMLTGRLPFKGDSNLELLQEVQKGKPEPLPDMAGTAELRPVLERCLEPDPGRRFANGEELARGLGGDVTLRLDGSYLSTLRMVRHPLLRRLALPLAGLLIVVAALAGALTGVVPFFRSGTGQHGIAVLPFTLMGEEGTAAEFGRGLSWTLANRLGRLERAGSDLWVMEPERIQELGLEDREGVYDAVGIGRTITAVGHMSAQDLTLLLTYYDLNGDRQATREFRDSLANLKTWQHEMVSWLIDVMDLDPARSGYGNLFSGCTTVPAAFVSCQQGLGRMLMSHESADLQAAHADFTRAVERDSSYAWAWAGLGRASWLLHRGEGAAGVATARAQLLKGAALDTSSAWPWVWLGELEEALGRDDQALACYRKALTTDPSHVCAMRRLGRLLQRLGHGGEAEEILMKMVAARPGDIRALTNRGMFYYGESRFPEAAADFRAVVDIAPGSVSGFSRLGAVLFEMGDFKGAEEMFRRSLAIRPSYTCYSNLGTLCYYDSRYRDAIDMFTRALAINDGDYQVWMNLAEAYAWIPGSRDSSRTAYGRALDLALAKLNRKAGQDMLISDVASIRANLGQVDEARRLLRGLATRETLGAEVMFGMADTYEKLGQRDSALNWLERAVAQDLSLAKVKFYPGLRNLRSTKRYRELQAKYRE